MFRNKISKKEERLTMVTLEEVKKAYEDLSEEDKKSFHQLVKDCADEGAGEQEHIDGDVDAQTEGDRADELEGGESADEVKSEEADTAPESEASEEVKDDAEAKTEGDKEPTIGEIMELVTKLAAEVAALRHAQETGKPVEQVGVDGEYVDEIAPSMPASYLEEAKKMRF